MNDKKNEYDKNLLLWNISCICLLHFQAADFVNFYKWLNELLWRYR